MTCSPSE